MENIDWSVFKKRISIKTDENRIYNAWITQNNLESWFLSKAQFFDKNKEPKDRFLHVEAGDTYQWMWYGSDIIAEGEVLQNNGKDYLEFTFLGCQVGIIVKYEHGENIIELIQSKIPLDESSRKSHYVGCTRGWTFYLTNLKSILEGGLDLRNKNISLEDVINT